MMRLITVMGMIVLAALPAQACQVVCSGTTVKYTGALGGVAAADAICVAQFGTGFRFARSSSAAGNLSGKATSSSGSMWVANVPEGTDNCSNWSVGTAPTKGNAISVSTNVHYNETNTTCDNLYPIYCCNI